MTSQTTIAKLDGLTVVIHHKPDREGHRCSQCMHYQSIPNSPQGYCILYQIQVLPIWSCINLHPTIGTRLKDVKNESLF